MKNVTIDATKFNKKEDLHLYLAEQLGLSERYGKTIEFGLTQAKPTKNDEAIPFLDDDAFIADMEAMLKAVVAEMLDTEVPFVQTEDEKKCRNCDFKGICGR